MFQVSRLSDQPGILGTMLTLAKALTSSGNRKIGNCSTTYAAQQSCPSSCVFKDGGGCYAETGLMAIHSTRPLNAAGEELDADALMVAVAEASAIDAMEVVQGRPMRLHTVGDCATDAAASVVAAAAARYRERGGGPVWTYTHAWRQVARASWGVISVLASCETPVDVIAAQARGYGASIVVDDYPTFKLYELGSYDPLDNGTVETTQADADSLIRPSVTGRVRALPCPAVTHGDVTCETCRLCMDDQGVLERGYAIAFAVHGTNSTVKKARLALADPDSATRRLTSRDFIDGYLLEHGRWPTSREVQDGADVTSGSAWEMLKRMKEAA